MKEESLAPGRAVAGAYRVDRMIGAGGMGTVWAATTIATGEMVALKVLSRAFASVPELRHRFAREARAGRALVHPNMVRLLAVIAIDDDIPVLVLELLRGETLRQILDREEALSLAMTATLMVPVIDAVMSAHALGIVHRDLKPENVFLADGPWGKTVKVLDFGIAKLTSDLGPLARTAALTAAGQSLGTAAYMAPEQMFGDPNIDDRADVWSLGAVLYECLSGGRPVEGANIVQTAHNLHAFGITPLAVALPSTPTDVTDLVARMLQVPVANRLADLAVARQVLAAYVQG